VKRLRHLRERRRDHAAVEKLHEKGDCNDQRDQALAIFGAEETFNRSSRRF
jgi:hypothetical protein